jgi:hypothetical protein
MTWAAGTTPRSPRGRSYQFDEEKLPTLEIALRFSNVEDLKKLAALTGEKVPSKKSDLVALIVQYLAGERLRMVWESLDEWQRAAVAEAVHSPSSQLNANVFRAKYGRYPDWGPAAEFSHDRKPSALCLFFHRNRMIPEDLKTRLLAFVPEPRQTVIATLDQLPPVYGRPFTRWNETKRTHEEGIEDVPLIVHETEIAAQRELISILRLVDAGKVSVSDKTHRASASTLDGIIAILDQGEYYQHVPPKDNWSDGNAGPIRAFAWPLLIQAGGLAQLSGTRLQLTKPGRRAIFEPAAGSIRMMWTKWVKTTIFDELARVECVKGQTGKGKRGLTAVSDRRETIAEALAECPPGGWIATEEFFRYMEATANTFTVTRDAWALYIGDQYVLSLLLEYAATLGMIDVALIPPAGARDDFHDLWGTDELTFFSRYDGLMYFRLTPLGAYCLGVESEYEPAPLAVKPVLQMLPNLEIVADPDLEKSDFLALNAYATPVADFVWRLEGGKLLAAIEAGRQVEEIRTFLTARSGTALPEEATRLLDDVAERINIVCDRGPACLIECADPAIAALIANDMPTRKHCLRAGERHLVVTASSEAAFRRALRRIQQRPRGRHSASVSYRASDICASNAPFRRSAPRHWYRQEFTQTLPPFV